MLRKFIRYAYLIKTACLGSFSLALFKCSFDQNCINLSSVSLSDNYTTHST